MRYRQTRTMIRWTGHPYLLAAKVCAILLQEEGLRGKGLAAEVRKTFPAIDIVAGVPVPDNTLAQRGDKGVRYPSEHYNASPETAAIAAKVRARRASGRPWPRVTIRP